MLTIEPTGAILGATIRGLDAAARVSDSDFGQMLAALGQYGVLRFPDQHLDEDGVRRFSQLFGDIQGPSSGALTKDGKEVPVVGILSNIKENGKYIGARRCRAGLAHRHVVSRRHWFRERAVWHPDSAA